MESYGPGSDVTSRGEIWDGGSGSGAHLGWANSKQGSATCTISVHDPAVRVSASYPPQAHGPRGLRPVRVDPTAAPHRPEQGDASSSPPCALLGAEAAAAEFASAELQPSASAPACDPGALTAAAPSNAPADEPRRASGNLNAMVASDLPHGPHICSTS
jgi:hypothetical protein